MKSCKFVLFGWLMVAVAGCASHDHMAFGTQLDHKEALSQTTFDEPLPGPLSNLLLAETALGESRVEPLKEGEKGYPFPRGAFDQVVAAMLRDSGGFETVGLAKDLQSGDSGSREGLILQIELEEQGVLFQSRTSGSGWALAGWILGITAIPSQWIHDEIYELRFRARAKILDWETDTVLLTLDLGECTAKEPLNFHERTSSFMPYLLTNIIPPSAISPDPASLLEALLPIAFSDAMVRLRDGFEEISAASRVDLIRIESGKSKDVSFEFKSPVDGQEAIGDTVDLEFDLVFPVDSTDFESVSINGEVEIENDPRRPMPIRKRIHVKRRGVRYANREIVISVALFEKIKPVETVIYIQEGL